jgi:hypothetical protein
MHGQRAGQRPAAPGHAADLLAVATAAGHQRDGRAATDGPATVRHNRAVTAPSAGLAWSSMAA